MEISTIAGNRRNKFFGRQKVLRTVTANAIPSAEGCPIGSAGALEQSCSSAIRSFLSMALSTHESSRIVDQPNSWQTWPLYSPPQILAVDLSPSIYPLTITYRETSRIRVVPHRLHYNNTLSRPRTAHAYDTTSSYCPRCHRACAPDYRLQSSGECTMHQEH